MSRVLEFNDLRAAAVLAGDWRRLLALTPRATFFQTFEWLRAYWRHFGAGQELRLLAIESAGTLLGIVPLVIRTEQHRFGAVRVLTYPLEDWGFWYAPVGPPSQAVATLAMQHVAATPRAWDLCELRWGNREEADRDGMAPAMAAVGMTPEQTATDRTSILALDEFTGWEDYLLSRTSKVRENIRWQLRRLARDHRVEFVRHRPAALSAGDGEPRWDLYYQCQRLAETSWQADLTEGNTLCHPRVRGFIRDAHIAAATLGMLDVNLLKIDGQFVAYAYNYHHAGRVFGLRMGYAAEQAPSGAGAALLYHMLRDGFERGDREFDLGVGDQTYKQGLRTHTAENYRLSYGAPLNWRPYAVRLTRWLRKSKNVKQTG